MDFSEVCPIFRSQRFLGTEKKSGSSPTLDLPYLNFTAAFGKAVAAWCQVDNTYFMVFTTILTFYALTADDLRRG